MIIKNKTRGQPGGCLFCYYLYIVEIALGIIGLLFGMYSNHESEKIRQKNENTQLRKSNDQFAKDSSDQLKSV
jgi:mannose/fructose/N-acetylgalactosamine-specific phosphotransferase system component IIC